MSAKGGKRTLRVCPEHYCDDAGNNEDKATKLHPPRQEIGKIGPIEHNGSMGRVGNVRNGSKADGARSGHLYAETL